MLHEKMLISNTNICINSLLDSCHYLLIIFYYAFYVCRIMQKKTIFFALAIAVHEFQFFFNLTNEMP